MARTPVVFNRPARPGGSGASEDLSLVPATDEPQIGVLAAYDYRQNSQLLLAVSDNIPAVILATIA
jgi:hypothetical protein